MTEGSAGRARALREDGLLDVLRLVQRQPGRTRAELARTLALSSGSATEIVTRLKTRQLAAEVDPEATGTPGRPSPRLVAHEHGPLIAIVEITYGGWRVAAAELGLKVLEEITGKHRSREPVVVVRELRTALELLERNWGARLRVVSISVPGIIVDKRVAQAPMLGWNDVDMTAAVPATLAARQLLVANDVTLAGLAEARCGAAAHATVALYLDIRVGLGGVIVDHGRPTLGATGGSGEFGHMPFGDPASRCPCGARGCWGFELDGRALARTLGRRAPANPTRFAATVLATASAGAGAERDAVDRAAVLLGRGVGGLVNALDPDLVVLGGDAGGFLAAAEKPLRGAYRNGLMKHRRAHPPEIVRAVLGTDSTLLGAAEVGFDELLTPDGLTSWDQSR
jgi:predicted NBD/HSP70 family sugar kinase